MPASAPHALTLSPPATEFVALLTSASQPESGAVAKASFTLVRSYLLFSISYER